MLAWLEAFSMFAAVIWLLTAGMFSSNDDHIVLEEATRI